MYKILVLLMLPFISANLYAYVDNDMDGVEDSVDKCPNTPFSDLVDLSGCTVQTMRTQKTKSHYDIIVGTSYSASNYTSLNRSDTFTASVQADYYYGDFSLQLSTSYYKTSSESYTQNGFDDSYIGASYSFKPSNNFSIRIGTGALLPTYDTTLANNKIDFTASVSFNYTVEKVSIYGSYLYTVVNDTDTLSDGVLYTYQNTNSYNTGMGYFLSDSFYLSVTYSHSDSIYRSIGSDSIEDIKTLSLYGYYAIDEHYFTTFEYRHGLSESASDHTTSIKLGYYF